MRKTVILCDRCRKEIEGHPIMIRPVTTDRETGDIIEDWRPEEFKKRDYCVDCAEIIMAAAQGMAEKKRFRDLFESDPDKGLKPDPKEEPEPEVKAGAVVEDGQQTAAEPAKKLDVGKIMALKDAGWSNEKIAEEMGSTPGTIAVYVCKARKERAGKKH